MCVTPYANVNRILDIVQSRIRDVVGTNLLALYLSGSLVTGDFDHDVSDIVRSIIPTQWQPTLYALGSGDGNMATRGGKGRRKVGRKKRRMRAKIRHRK